MSGRHALAVLFVVLMSCVSTLSVADASDRRESNCRIGQMQVRVEHAAFAAPGWSSASVMLTNTSPHGCGLEGYPSLSMSDRERDSMPFVYSHAGDRAITATGPSWVRVPAGGSVFFGLDQRRCAPGNETVTTMRIALPGTSASRSFGMPPSPALGYCGVPSASLIVTVSPIVGRAADESRGAPRVPPVLLSTIMTGAGTLRATGGVSLRCAASCYRQSTMVTAPGRVSLSAAPAPGWKLLAWVGACAGPAAACSLEFTHATSVGAVFTPTSPVMPGAKTLPLTEFPAGLGPEGVRGLVANSAVGRLVTGPDGNVWFADRYANSVGRMTPTGEVTEFLIPGQGSVNDIAAGPDGNLWFTENVPGKAGSTSAIGRITPSGTITQFAVPGAGKRVNDITAGADGNLWFTEYHEQHCSLFVVVKTCHPIRQKIGRITPAGEITEFSLPTAGSQLSAIVAGSDGNVWFGEEFGQRIGRITPGGSVTEFTIPNSRRELDDITAGPDGNIWFTTSGSTLDSHAVGRITPDGKIGVFVVPGGRGDPEWIATGPDGNLWFNMAAIPSPDLPRGQKIGPKICRITPAGAITEFDAPETGDITAGPNDSLWLGTAYGIAEITLVK